jgi:hypothetical protein
VPGHRGYPAVRDLTRLEPRIDQENAAGIEMFAHTLNGGAKTGLCEDVTNCREQAGDDVVAPTQREIHHIANLEGSLRALATRYFDEGRLQINAVDPEPEVEDAPGMSPRAAAHVENGLSGRAYLSDQRLEETSFGAVVLLLGVQEVIELRSSFITSHRHRP